MTDIVKRLRKDWPEELTCDELCEAADEIERLRAALRKIKRCAYVDWSNSIYIKGKDDLHIREFIAGVLREKK